MRVCFVATPLTARSGVYRSAREIVTGARNAGLEWSLILGVSAKARGSALPDDPDWIDEQVAEPAGLSGIRRAAARLETHRLVRSADLVVSLLPQSDMALATTPLTWAAFVRGLPWPAPGESSAPRRLIWKTLEQIALGRAAGVWATTPVLRASLPNENAVTLVPAGIKPIPRQWDGRGKRETVVWAARFNQDKNPETFIRAMTGAQASGVLYGSGPMERSLRASAPPNVTVKGWVDPAELWTDAMAYAGTSHREAFGRSAVEAAMAGIPVILADSFGAAPLLITDPELSRRFVLPSGDPSAWRNAINSLVLDRGLCRALSNHVHENARDLTIEASIEHIAIAAAGIHNAS